MPQSKLMPSILDREITAKADDAFGHQDFANALRSLIESEHNQPPYSIGLLGPWGTGKSRNATWLHNIDGEAQLKDLNPDVFSATERDIEILKERFPGKRKELEKYLKKISADRED